MEKQIFRRAKKTLAILLLVSFAVSLTAASVSAKSSGEKAQAILEKGNCQKQSSFMAPSEKGTCAKSMVESQSSQNKGTCAKSIEKPAKGKGVAHRKYGCDCCCRSANFNEQYFCDGKCGYFDQCLATPGTTGWCLLNA